MGPVFKEVLKQTSLAEDPMGPQMRAVSNSLLLNLALECLPLAIANPKSISSD